MDTFFAHPNFGSCCIQRLPVKARPVPPLAVATTHAIDPLYHNPFGKARSGRVVDGLAFTTALLRNSAGPIYDHQQRRGGPQ